MIGKNDMPTLRQEKAAKEMVKVLKSGKEDINKGEVLEKVGYSAGIVKSPSRVLESVGYKEVLDRILPDERLAKKHEQLLEDEKSEVQVKALDMAYKVKSSYAPEKHDIAETLDILEEDRELLKSFKFSQELKNNVSQRTTTSESVDAD